MRKGGLPLNRKFIILSLYFFSTICLFSVGFSSWTICMGDKLTASGNIVAEDVFNYSDYINFNGDVQGFKYCDAGFVSEDETTISDTGTCIAKLKINANNCKSHYSESNLKVQVEFKYKNSCNINLFDGSVCSIGYTAFVDDNPKTSEITGEVIGNGYKIILTLSDYDSLANSDGEINITIKLHFDLNNDVDFSALLEEIPNMHFDCNVSMEGC